ncbi:MAG: hypothetical protein COB53_09100 [Elusimicrobia bacterium]|nr:MAG: hypothetical protein COB53_09100 [Elusimicrobiota bacterium]
MSAEKPVASTLYSKEYFLNSCGGIEFFERYGPKVLKPAGQGSFLAAGVEKGMRVLDIGCGRGELLYRAREIGADAIGTDYAEAALDVAAEVSGCPVLRCDAKKLPFADASFDRVFLIGVIDHLHDWEGEECFDEIKRVLRPGGLAVIHTCVNRFYFKALTYAARMKCWRGVRALGFAMAEPRPPRTDEDADLHVNEHTYWHLKRFFAGINWSAEVHCVPNAKLLIPALYGENRPDDFPIKAAPGWKRALYFGLLLHWPLDRFLAREFLVVARPHES